MTPSQNPYAPPEAQLLDRAAPANVGVETAIPRVLGVLSIVFGGLAVLVVALMFVAGLAFYRAKTRASAQVEARTKPAEMKPTTKPPAARAPAARAAPRPTDSAKKSKSKSTKSEPIALIAGLVGITLVFLAPPILLFLGIGQLRYRRWARWASLAWAWWVCGAAAVLTFLMWLDTSGGEALAMVILWIFILPYPIVLLALLSRPRVRAAMCR